VRLFRGLSFGASGGEFRCRSAIVVGEIPHVSPLCGDESITISGHALLGVEALGLEVASVAVSNAQKSPSHERRR